MPLNKKKKKLLIEYPAVLIMAYSKMIKLTLCSWSLARSPVCCSTSERWSFLKLTVFPLAAARLTCQVKVMSLPRHKVVSFSTRKPQLSNVLLNTRVYVFSNDYASALKWFFLKGLLYFQRLNSRHFRKALFKKNLEEIPILQSLIDAENKSW